MKRTLAIFAFFLTVILPAVLPVESARAAVWQHEPDYIGRAIQKSDARTDQNDARAGVRSGKLLPLSKVLNKVHRQIPGRLLDAQLLTGRSGPVYFIKLMTRDGNVAIITADATTGEVLEYRRGGH